ncbi:MAG: SUMF1/EgtB/PvdO family nonheme iron enzyme, partial [Anaerolineales bacterium]|nr:SUMF1/EgtB/PvdO family nonheme iron enzyme [Anaerolineales bacterium]
YIPAGEFAMGDNIYGAKHSVNLSGYWIQQTKVTNRMYEQCVRAGVCTSPTQELGGPVFSNPEFASHPVVGVNWEQAQSYCNWIQGSLPTEAQWERASVSGTAYPWGNANPSCELLNFANCFGRTTKVTTYENGTSPFGLFDMAGNVFEWAFDWYDANYYGQSPVENPTGPESGQYRVIRGSSFESAPEQISSTIRRFNEPLDSGRDIGFRCAVANPQPFAPYCQLRAGVPANTQVSTNTCALPEGVVLNQYCQQGDGYAVVQISFESVWDERGTRIQCEEKVEGGLRTLTCRGPRGIESTNEVVVCNPACTNQVDVSGLSPVCDSGYTFDSSSRSCVYSPIAAQPSTGGCPIGYITKESNGQQFCVASIGLDGFCPIGLYFDDAAGMCAPPNGQSNTPFGINNPTLAQQTFAGCAAGYAYSENFQCCQPNPGSVLLGCPAGTVFNENINACVPALQETVGGEGCITVRVNTLKCSTIEDTVCAPIDTESRCVAQTTCKWNESANVCEPK